MSSRIVESTIRLEGEAVNASVTRIPWEVVALVGVAVVAGVGLGIMARRISRRSGGLPLS